VVVGKVGGGDQKGIFDQLLQVVDIERLWDLCQIRDFRGIGSRMDCDEGDVRWLYQM